MKRLSRHLWLAALCVAMSPAIGRSQTNFYAPDSGAMSGGVVPASATMFNGGEGGGACANCCDDGCCDGCCGHFGCNWPCGCALSDLGEACKLWKPHCEESQWYGSGWLAQSFVWNPYSPADRFNGPVTWTDRSNDYQMNELYYTFGRLAKTDQCCWDWGMKVTGLYGTSYRWDTSAGFESHWGNGQFYGLAVPDAYLQAGNNGWDIKVGRWVSPVGFYTVGTGNNFFNVIPYTYQYGQPFTHTGAWVNKKINDQWTVGGAITHGWDNTDNTGNNHAGGLVNAAWTIDEERALAYVGVFGPEPNLSGVNPSSVISPLGTTGTGYTSRYLQTLVYSKKFGDTSIMYLETDFGTQHDAVVAGQTAKWYSLNGWYYWNLKCRCQWGINAEWFRDQGGFRVGQVLPSFGSPNARGLARAGFDGSFYRLTFGPKYYFTPNIYGRCNFLADWYDGKRNTAGQLPFDDGIRGHQQIVVFDLIGTF